MGRATALCHPRGTPGAPCHSLSYCGVPAAVTVHSCTSPSTWLPCSPCPLSWAGSGSHGAAGALPLREGPPRPRPRSCGADLPIPARRMHTCPEAPGWAMHTIGTHSRLAKPPLFKHHGTRSNPDKSSRPRAPPQNEQDWGGRGQGEGPGQRGSGPGISPTQASYQRLSFSPFFPFLEKNDILKHYCEKLI